MTSRSLSSAVLVTWLRLESTYQWRKIPVNSVTWFDRITTADIIDITELLGSTKKFNIDISKKLPIKVRKKLFYFKSLIVFLIQSVLS